MRAGSDVIASALSSSSVHRRASGLVIGDYLTTEGQSQDKTKQMLADLQLMLRPMEETQQWHNKPSTLN